MEKDELVLCVACSSRSVDHHLSFSCYIDESKSKFSVNSSTGKVTAILIKKQDLNNGRSILPHREICDTLDLKIFSLFELESYFEETNLIKTLFCSPMDAHLQMISNTYKEIDEDQFSNLRCFIASTLQLPSDMVGIKHVDDLAPGIPKARIAIMNTYIYKSLPFMVLKVTESEIAVELIKRNLLTSGEYVEITNSTFTEEQRNTGNMVVKKIQLPCKEYDMMLKLLRLNSRRMKQTTESSDPGDIWFYNSYIQPLFPLDKLPEPVELLKIFASGQQAVETYREIVEYAEEKVEGAFPKLYRKIADSLEDSSNFMVRCHNVKCTRQIDTVKELKKCAKCKRASYCSKSCQLEDWPSHKKVCKPSGDQDKSAGAEEVHGEERYAALLKLMKMFADDNSDCEDSWSNSSESEEDHEDQDLNILYMHTLIELRSNSNKNSNFIPKEATCKSENNTKVDIKRSESDSSDADQNFIFSFNDLFESDEYSITSQTLTIDTKRQNSTGSRPAATSLESSATEINTSAIGTVSDATGSESVKVDVTLVSETASSEALTTKPEKQKLTGTNPIASALESDQAEAAVSLSLTGSNPITTEAEKQKLTRSKPAATNSKSNKSESLSKSDTMRSKQIKTKSKETSIKSKAAATRSNSFKTEKTDPTHSKSITTANKSDEVAVERKKVDINLKECGMCGRMGENMKCCLQCRAVYYCSLGCQHSDWRQHRPHCRMSDT